MFPASLSVGSEGVLTKYAGQGPRGCHAIISRSIKRASSSFPGEIRLKTNSKTNSTCHILINSLPEGVQCYCYADRAVPIPISCHKQFQSVALLNNQSQRTGCWPEHSKSRCIIYSASLFTQKHNNPHRFGGGGGYRKGKTLYQQRDLQSLEKKRIQLC